MGKKKRNWGCCRPTRIASKLRYYTESALELTAEEVAFGAMALKIPAGRSGPTCGQVLDAMMSAGYVNAERNFEKCVEAFAAGVHALKKKLRRAFPAWSEILRVAKSLGWRLPAPETGDLLPLRSPD